MDRTTRRQGNEKRWCASNEFEFLQDNVFPQERFLDASEYLQSPDRRFEMEIFSVEKFF